MRRDPALRRARVGFHGRTLSRTQREALRSRLFYIVFALLASLGAMKLARADDAPAQWNPAPGDTLEVALVTIGPGDIYWERFGHNAIAIRDTRDGRATLYNFGIFDFEQTNFLLNFMRGRMQYLGVAEPFDGALDDYVRAGRPITLQPLNLSPVQRLTLQQTLERAVAPENAAYRYDYYVNNCSTRVRDAIDHALGGAVQRALGGRSRGFTWRMQTQRLTAPEPWLYLGTHLGLSAYVDRPVSYWEEAFVPMELARRIGDVRVTDDAGRELSLVASNDVLARARIAQPAEMPPSWRVGFVLAGLALGAVVFVLGRARTNPLARFALAIVTGGVWLACALGGLVLAALWTLTEHQSAYANENLFVLNPLCLALLPAVVAFARGRAVSRWIAMLATLVVVVAAFGLFAKVLPGFAQDNLDWLVLLLPFHFAAAHALRERVRAGQWVARAATA